MFSKKWEEIDKAALLTEGILNGNEKFEFESLARQRAEDRNLLLTEIRKLTETEATPVTKKKTKKPKKPKDPKGRSTFDITLDLLATGMTVEQIAHERGLVTSTIESHLAKGVEEGKVSIFSFIPEETVMEIINARRQLPEGSGSKDLYERLKGKFSYGQLRAVAVYAKLNGQPS